MKSFKDKISKKKIKEHFFPGLDIFEGIGDFFSSMEGISDFFSSIIDFLDKITKIISWVLKIVVWAFKFIIFMIIEVVNPIIIIRDIYELSFDIPYELIYAFKNLVNNTSKLITNSLFEPLFNNIFGWDSTKDNKNTDRYEQKEGEMSLTLILSTILLPPLGVFMKFGLRKWNDILITGGLTMIFYFPGLIFALVKIFT